MPTNNTYITNKPRYPERLKITACYFGQLMKSLTWFYTHTRLHLNKISYAYAFLSKNSLPFFYLTDEYTTFYTILYKNTLAHTYHVQGILCPKQFYPDYIFYCGPYSITSINDHFSHLKQWINMKEYLQDLNFKVIITTGLLM
jgi:hypothetical protein